MTAFLQIVRLKLSNEVQYSPVPQEAVELQIVKLQKKAIFV